MVTTRTALAELGKTPLAVVWALLLLTLPTWIGGQAWAQEPPAEDQVAVILFAAEGVDPAQGSRLGDVLRRTMRLAQKAGLQVPTVADLDRKNDGMLILEGEQHLVAATRYFGRGLEHMTKGRDKPAYEEFERALHFYRSAYPYAQSDELYTDVAFYAAQMAQRQKGKDQRKKDFERCEAMGLVVELAGARDQLDRINEVHPECEWEIEDPENAELEVTTKPTGARVYVDGQYRGVTPVKLKKLRRGEHVFTFVREGFRRVSRILRIGERFSEARELEMGLQLKPGVYRSVYKDLIPVVRGTAEDENDTCTKVADTLEVGGLMMVLTIPNKEGGVKVYLFNWKKGSPDGVRRTSLDLDLSTPDRIEDSVVQVLSTVFQVKAADLPSLAERPPLYFKLQATPYVPEEEY